MSQWAEIRHMFHSAGVPKKEIARGLALPGVHAVITGPDLPTKYGVIPWTPDETTLAVDKVCFVCDVRAYSGECRKGSSPAASGWKHPQQFRSSAHHCNYSSAQGDRDA